MRVINLFQMNNWRIKKFLIVILSIQFSLWGLIVLDALNIHIPILREIISFIYLIFVPGILILRILRLHEFNNIETTLYAAGLSVATLMFTGFFMNTIYPFLGIRNPITIKPLIITISVLVLVLCGLSYVFDKDFFKSTYLEFKNIFSNSSLFLSIIPFLAIFGTYLMNNYQINTLNILLIIVISVIVIFTGFNRISEKYYPFLILLTSISLLFFVSLISNYLAGSDIISEFYISNLVIKNGIWDSTLNMIPNSMLNVNSILSIVMFAPILSIVSDLNLMWVYKIFYPLIYCLVPIGLYEVFREQTNSKIALFSVFYFMFTFSFYFGMVFLARQEIAELFFVCLILLTTKMYKKPQLSFLLIVFTMALIVSHYGLSYTYILLLLGAGLLLLFMNLKKISSIFKIKNVSLRNNLNIGSTIILFTLVFCFCWYIYTANASAFNSIIHLSDNIAKKFYSDFLNPEYAQGAGIIISANLPMYEVTKYLNLITQFFVTIGLFSIIFFKNRVKLNIVFLALSIISFLIAGAVILIPYFGVALQTYRVYHITQFFLAPFFILGLIRLYEILYLRKNYDTVINSSLKLASIFLAIFLIFNSGLAYEVTGEIQNTISLIPLHPNYNNAIYNEAEFVGANWLYSEKNNGTVYADNFRTPLLAFFITRTRVFSGKVNQFILPNSYIYLGKWNIKSNELVARNLSVITSEVGFINNSDILKNKDKIYSNNNAEVYYNV